MYILKIPEGTQKKIFHFSMCEYKDGDENICQRIPINLDSAMDTETKIHHSIFESLFPIFQSRDVKNLSQDLVSPLFQLLEDHKFYRQYKTHLHHILYSSFTFFLPDNFHQLDTETIILLNKVITSISNHMNTRTCLHFDHLVIQEYVSVCIHYSIPLPDAKVFKLLCANYELLVPYCIQLTNTALLEIASLSIPLLISLIEMEVFFIDIGVDLNLLPFDQTYTLFSDAILECNEDNHLEYINLFESIGTLFCYIKSFQTLITQDMIDNLFKLMMTIPSNDFTFGILQLILCYLEYLDDQDNKEAIGTTLALFDINTYQSYLIPYVITSTHMLLVSKMLVFHYSFYTTDPFEDEDNSNAELLHFAIRNINNADVRTQAYTVKYLYYYFTYYHDPSLYELFFHETNINDIINILEIDSSIHEGYPILLIAKILDSVRDEVVSYSLLLDYIKDSYLEETVVEELHEIGNEDVDKALRCFMDFMEEMEKTE